MKRWIRPATPPKAWSGDPDEPTRDTDIKGFARINSENKVVKIHGYDKRVWPNDDDVIEFLSQFLEEGEYIVKADDRKRGLRYNIPHVGDSYDKEADAFIPKKPVHLPSAILDRTTFTWKHPIPMPTEEVAVEYITTGIAEVDSMVNECWGWVWNEEDLQWEYRNHIGGVVYVPPRVLAKIKGAFPNPPVRTKKLKDS